MVYDTEIMLTTFLSLLRGNNFHEKCKKVIMFILCIQIFKVLNRDKQTQN